MNQTMTHRNLVIAERVGVRVRVTPRQLRDDCEATRRASWSGQSALLQPNRIRSRTSGGVLPIRRENPPRDAGHWCAPKRSGVGPPISGHHFHEVTQ
jgi:hypothetical protein